MAAAASAVRLAALLALSCAALLAGCAGLPFGDRADEASDTQAPAAPPAEPVYRLEVVAPSGALRLLLSTYLDLARFQDAPQTERITPAELDRLIAAAPAQARSLLETEGYFNAAVRVEEVPAANWPPRWDDIHAAQAHATLRPILTAAIDFAKARA